MDELRPMRRGAKTDHLSWSEYFMNVAVLSSLRSKDPNTKVGACIVNKHNHIISIGYNGLPVGCSDEDFPWGRDGDPLDTKYPFVVHAEANAVVNRGHNDIRGCTLFTTLFPCNECAKLIIQSGITSIVYLDNKYNDSWQCNAARMMFDAANIFYRAM